MKEEALKLADKLEEKWNPARTGLHDECIRMIRKLVAELDKAEPAILDAFNSGKGVGYVDGMRAVKSKPLSDEEIRKIAEKELGHGIGLIDWLLLARAIEKVHGIE